MTKSKPLSVTAAEPSLPPDTSFLFNSNRTWVMGVINATPDSFYSDSRRPQPDSAFRLAKRMVEEGADVLDVGGESTRPGSVPVSLATELERVLPVISALRERWPHVPLSIDTQKSGVARQALAQGVRIVNDISAMRTDPAIADVISETDTAVVLMHMQGVPATMQVQPHYTHVVDEVCAFFEDRMTYAERRGIRHDRIVLDPGFGFGKTLEQNMDLLKGLSRFLRLGRPILVGVSRKSFIGRLLGTSQSPVPAEDRLEGSLAAALWAVKSGARGLRVHDVGATWRALRLWEGLASA